MLNGTEPIIIFQFSALAPFVSAELAKIPLVSQVNSFIAQPPIPVYLSEKATGLMISSESKNVDIDTNVETKSDGSEPDISQKGIGSTVTINIETNIDSLGVILISALVDLVFEKLTSKEYTITYMHGATTIFRGVLHTYAVDTDSNTDKMTLKIELSRGEKQPTKKSDVPTVPKATGLTPF